MPVMRLVILLVAAAAAISAAFLVNSMQGNGVASVAPIQTLSLTSSNQVEVPTLKVLVAASDLKVGQFIRKDQLSWEEWPEKANTVSFFTQEADPDALEAMLGAVVRTNILAGEPLTIEKVTHPGEAGFMSAVLTPGMRAVAVEITSETAAGGFIYPNDRVDVLLTFQVEVIKPEGIRDETAVDKILSNVRVLAIDGYYQPVETDAGEAIVGNRITLELSSQDAMVLMAAKKKGEITLALRSISELAGPSGATATGRALASRQGGGADGVRVFEKGVNVAPMSAPRGVVQSQAMSGGYNEADAEYPGRGG